MPKVLVSRFLKLSDQLSEAIAADDENRIRALDKDVQLAFEQLLSSEPKTNEDKIELARFLIEYITNGADRTELQRQASEKLLKLLG